MSLRKHQQQHFSTQWAHYALNRELSLKTFAEWMNQPPVLCFKVYLFIVSVILSGLMDPATLHPCLWSVSHLPFSYLDEHNGPTTTCSSSEKGPSAQLMPFGCQLLSPLISWIFSVVLYFNGLTHGHGSTSELNITVKCVLLRGYSLPIVHWLCVQRLLCQPGWNRPVYCD